MGYLSEKEWIFLSNALYRLYQCDTYDDLCKTLFSQMQKVIMFDAAVCFQIEENGGNIKRTHPIFYPSVHFFPNFESFVENSGDGSTNELVFSLWSTVFRQSDVVREDVWKNSHIYNTYWKPANFEYGLTTYLVHQENSLSTITLFKNPNKEDFSSRDMFIMDIIKNHMSLKMYQLVNESIDSLNKQSKDIPNQFFEAAIRYNLTRRETEVIYLLCEGWRRQAICNRLYISGATLKKHIYNIYNKVGVNSQTQLLVWAVDHLKK